MATDTNGLIPEIVARQAELSALRRDIHANPETAFEEQRTAALVAETLGEIGVEVHTGLARTGVVGTIRAGTSDRAIGLRADMDALHIHEQNHFDHRSQIDGKMHACGHDGHTTMLLGAAHHLATTKNFDGTVHLIFQPAEENEGGGREMIEDGLFEKFPCDAVFGMHNIPGIPLGHFGVMPGPMMASFDIFEVTVTGSGTHAAMPQTGTDTIVAATAMVQALQSVVSRNVAPLDAAVLSVTQIRGGDTWNVLPQAVTFSGTTRAFKTETQDALEAALHRIVNGLAASFGVDFAVKYDRRYPPTINSEREAVVAGDVIEAAFGAGCLNRNAEPLMAAEDFAFMLQEKPGSYVWLGNGIGSEGGCMVHNPNYDFNDNAIPYGASYWVHLTEHLLSKDTDSALHKSR